MKGAVFFWFLWGVMPGSSQKKARQKTLAGNRSMQGSYFFTLALHFFSSLGSTRLAHWDLV